MPVIDKSKLMAFAKKKAAAPLAAQGLQQKRALAKAAPPKPPLPPQATKAAATVPDEDEEAWISELVEEAAQEAEAGADQDMEDLVAGYTKQEPGAQPAWATDAEVWHEAAEAVGLGQPDLESRYDEPFVVAAYLYKKMGGKLAGAERQTSPEQAPQQPGSIATALKARSSPPQGDGTPTPEEAAPDLKQLLDEASIEASAAPDSAITTALAGSPPSEGVAPAWAPDSDKWAMAETAVKAHWDTYPDPWLIVATVYKKLGGTIGAAQPQAVVGMGGLNGSI